MFYHPFRLALHEYPQERVSHLDLFLLLYGKGFLSTYEISTDFAEDFEKKRKENIRAGSIEVSLWAAGPAERAKSKEQRGEKSIRISLSPILTPIPMKARNSQKERSTESLLWKAFSKSQHRLHYWNYSGPLSGERGVLKGLGYGKLFYKSKEEFYF